MVKRKKRVTGNLFQISKLMIFYVHSFIQYFIPFYESFICDLIRLQTDYIIGTIIPSEKPVRENYSIIIRIIFPHQRPYSNTTHFQTLSSITPNISCQLVSSSENLSRLTSLLPSISKSNGKKGLYTPLPQPILTLKQGNYNQPPDLS